MRRSCAALTGLGRTDLVLGGPSALAQSRGTRLSAEGDPDRHFRGIPALGATQMPWARPMTRATIAMALLMLSFAQAANAGDDSKPEIRADDRALVDFAHAHPACTSFTDLCRTCVRGTDGHMACSTPGIACVRQDWKCIRSATSDK